MFEEPEVLKKIAARSRDISASDKDQAEMHLVYEEGMPLIRRRGEGKTEIERRERQDLAGIQVENLRERGVWIAHALIDRNDGMRGNREGATNMAVRTEEGERSVINKFIQALRLMPWRLPDAEFSCSAVVPQYGFEVFAPVGLLASSGKLQEVSSSDEATYFIPGTQQRVKSPHKSRRVWKSDNHPVNKYEWQRRSEDTLERVARGDRLTDDTPPSIKKDLEELLARRKMMFEMGISVNYNEVVVANPKFSALYYDLDSDRGEYAPNNDEFFEMVNATGIPVVLRKDNLFWRAGRVRIPACRSKRGVIYCPNFPKEYHGCVSYLKCEKPPEGEVVTPYLVDTFVGVQEISPEEIAKLPTYAPSAEARKWANAIGIKQMIKKGIDGNPPDTHDLRHSKFRGNPKLRLKDRKDRIDSLGEYLREAHNQLNSLSDGNLDVKEMEELTFLVSYYIPENLKGLPPGSKAFDRLGRMTFHIMGQLLFYKEKIFAVARREVLKNNTYKGLVNFWKGESEILHLLREDLMRQMLVRNILNIEEQIGEIGLSFGISVERTNDDFSFSQDEILEWKQR